MSDSKASRIFEWSRAAALALAVGLVAGCFDDIEDTVAPGPEATPERSEPRLLGFVQVTFDGIGTSNLSSSILTAPTTEALEELSAERERLRASGEDVAPDLTAVPGDHTIQFGPLLKKDQFVHDGVRYIRATYRVRNAQSDGTAYSTPRSDLALYGIASSNTLDSTAIRYINMNGEGSLPAGYALSVIPTGAVELQGGSVVSVRPDGLQVQRVSQLTAGTVNASEFDGFTILDYAFVVRNIDDDSHALPASPDADQFEGIVDFAMGAALLRSGRVERRQGSIVVALGVAEGISA